MSAPARQLDPVDPASVTLYEALRDRLGVHRVVTRHRHDGHSHVIRGASLDEARRIAAFLLAPARPLVAQATVRGSDVHLIPA